MRRIREKYDHGVGVYLYISAIGSVIHPPTHFLTYPRPPRPPPRPRPRCRRPPRASCRCAPARRACRRSPAPSSSPVWNGFKCVGVAVCAPRAVHIHGVDRRTHTALPTWRYWESLACSSRSICAKTYSRRVSPSSGFMVIFRSKERVTPLQGWVC